MVHQLVLESGITCAVINQLVLRSIFLLGTDQLAKVTGGGEPSLLSW